VVTLSLKHHTTYLINVAGVTTLFYPTLRLDTYPLAKSHTELKGRSLPSPGIFVFKFIGKDKERSLSFSANLKTKMPRGIVTISLSILFITIPLI